MDAAQFKYEFSLTWDNINSLSAPGFTGKEISYLLTRGQEAVVKTRYQSLGNKYRQGFESTEKRRSDLDELIVNTDLNIISSTSTPHPYGKFFVLPTNFMYGIAEEATISVDATNCTTYNEFVDYVTIDAYTDRIDFIRRGSTTLKRVPIKPITYDQYVANVKNPFKRPYKENQGLVWRMDYQKDVPGNYRRELITDGSFWVITYHLSYLKFPKAIVVPPDTGEVYGLSDMIDNEGESVLMSTISSQTSELSPDIHREIIAEAVKIASANLKDTTAYQIQAVQNEETE